MTKKYFNSEVLTKNLIADFFFDNVDFNVGDKPKEGLPDIYTNDRKIGIEVVESELNINGTNIDHIYRNVLVPACLDRDANLESCLKKKKELEENIQERHKKITRSCLEKKKELEENNKAFKEQLGLSEEDDLFLVEHSEGDVSYITLNEKRSRPIDYANKHFEKAIAKKIEKMNNEYYRAIEGEMYLAIVSIFRNKDSYEADNAIKLFEAAENNKFDGLIIVFSCYLAMYRRNKSKVEEANMTCQKFNDYLRSSTTKHDNLLSK